MVKNPIGKWVAIGIILLFVGVTIAPAMAQNTEKLSASRGNWLYVGGSGPGNYTRIQDAIENASDGDTVFVYDDSSPYIENNRININKSLNLIGENCYSTIIDGSNKSALIRIYSDNVTISGFTLQNFTGYGIHSTGKNIIISHNRIIDYDSSGIEILDSNVKIFSNEFTLLTGTALLIWECDNIDVYRNNFTECNDIFWFVFASRTNVYENNFLSHKYASMSWVGFLFVEVSPLKIKFYQNYWYQPRFLPKPIFGLVGKISIILSILLGELIPIPLPWVLFDYTPAKEPYDIHQMT